MTETGQIENFELRDRAAARKKQMSADASLAEKLIFASTTATFSFSFRGVAVDAYIPTTDEINALVSTAENAGQLGEQTAETKIYDIVAGLLVDDSITPDVLRDPALGAGFIKTFMFSLFDFLEEEGRGARAVKSFRKNKNG